MNATRVAVVGGGMSGLAAAFRLSQGFARAGRPLALSVLEAADHAGGHATTLEEDGFLIELGPNGFLDRAHEPWTRELARDLGIEASLLEARPAAKRRFILDGGRLRRAPDTPPALLTSDALSPAGKLRLLLEPFARPVRPGIEETVFDFAERRVGREAAERLVDAAVSGISAGDSRALSVSAAFPLMAEMERDHGSLIRAMIARRRMPPSRLRAFRGGMAELVGALRARLGGALRTGCAVTRLARAGEAWQLTPADGPALAADVVVLAQHAWAAAPLVESLDPALARELAGFPSAGLALVALAFRETDVPRPLDGYGYLVARGEGLETLGVVWESSLFEGRAPAGAVLLRAMIGGVRHPGLDSLAEEELLGRVRRELAPVLGVTAAPLRGWVRRWPASIAQYTLGHGARVARARALAARHPGLELSGTSYDGASFNGAVHSGVLLAERLLAREAGRSGAPAAPGAGGGLLVSGGSRRA
jgi:oxygen-dependent protoporphyrinogen oxidase